MKIFFFFSSHIWNSLLDDVDFNYYRDDILELLDEFDSRFSPITSTINFDNLIALIMNRTTNGKYEHITKELEKIILKLKEVLMGKSLLPRLLFWAQTNRAKKTIFSMRP